MIYFDIKLYRTLQSDILTCDQFQR